MAVEVFSDDTSLLNVGLRATIDDDTVISDASWKCSSQFADNWPSVDFDDSSWAQATEIGT